MNCFSASLPLISERQVLIREMVKIDPRELCVLRRVIRNVRRSSSSEKV